MMMNADDTTLVYDEEAIKHLVHGKNTHSFRLASDTIDRSIDRSPSELKCLNEVNNAVIAELSRDAKFSLRVPLACIINYKGFVILAIAQPLIDGDNTLVKGRSTYPSGDDTQSQQTQYIDKTSRTSRVWADLIRLGASLNLKPHTISEPCGNMQVEISADIAVHCLSSDDYSIFMKN